MENMTILTTLHLIKNPVHMLQLAEIINQYLHRFEINFSASVNKQQH